MFVRATNEAANTPLHLAAQYGHADVAALLVQRGADVNAVTTTTRYGRTPLHDAVDGLAGTSDLEGRLEVGEAAAFPRC